MAKRKKRNGFRRFPSGYGSITKLSGKRRRPYMVKVNTRMDERGYPQFDILGYFAEESEALIALAEYNKNPYDVKVHDITFKEVYEKWYKQKYETGKRKYSESTIRCTIGAYKKVSALHDVPIREIRADHMQELVDNYDLSHAYMEHILNLFRQVFDYACKYDILEKDYSKFVQITKDDDDEAGVPFTSEEIEILWKNKDDPTVQIVLILIYSGWRINELLSIKKSDVDLENMTFTGGSKTKAGKNRTVPIHSAIQPFIVSWYDSPSEYLLNSEFLSHDGKYKKLLYGAYRKQFICTLDELKIQDHTPHDCRHTFSSLLHSAGADALAVKIMMGHSSKDLTERVYTHKDIDELRANIELIKVEF